MPLDPQSIHDLVVGVCSNGLSTLIAHASGKLVNAFKLNPVIDTATMYAEAAAQVCKEFAHDTSSRQKIKRFLNSPEIESMVRQLYASNLVDQSQTNLSTIREEFLGTLAAHLDVLPSTASTVGNVLFDAVLTECDKQLSRAIKSNALTAHEAKATIRHRWLLNEIANIRRTLELFNSPNVLSIDDILQFEQQYRAQVGDRHRYIQPPNVDSARKFPIDELYVTPSFLPGLRKRQEAVTISLEHFLSTTHRTVVLGNPGGGKSTLAAKLCNDLSTRYDRRLLNGRLLTPILVVLREYGGQKKTDHCSILQFIESQANSRYQVPVPRGAFEYLCLAGRVVIIFDGLDELLDTGYRQEITSDVESFCNLYPSTPIVVTSREVGYDQAPLDAKGFTLFKIASFDESQISDYATKWFMRDEDLTPDQRKQKTKAFLAESAVAPDLRSNPLMLGLMCNLYRVDGYIPRNRPEIYEKCSLMLFERWDKSRGIVLALPFEEHIRPAMQHLAYWIYSQESFQGGVTEGKLIDEASTYLNKWVFEDLSKARKAAQDFIGFCTGRAWVFTDTGTTAEGEKLYQFTHRTFLEYFAATYLFSVHPTAAELGPALAPRIAKQEWDVVALLAFQIQSRRIQGAADKLLGILLEEAIQRSSEERWSTLLFAARCLQSIVPSPAVRRSVAAACTRELYAGDAADRGHRARPAAHAMLGTLCSTSAENRSTVSETMEQVLVAGICSGQPRERINAYQIAFELRHATHFAPEFTAASDNSQFWESVVDRILTESFQYLDELAAKDLLLAILAYNYGKWSVVKILECHGTRALFRAPYSRIFLFWRPPVIARLLDRVLRTDGSETAESEMAMVGRYLVSLSPPWIELRREESEPDYRMFTHDLFHRTSRKLEATKIMAADSACAYGIFVGLAVVFETVNIPDSLDFVRGIERIGAPPLATAMSAIRRRIDPVLNAEPDLSGIEEPFRGSIADWMAGKVSFVNILPDARGTRPRRPVAKKIRRK